MSPRGTPQKPSLHRVVDAQRVSPDDVLSLLRERDRQKALDTRTDLEKIFGDPPRHRSALTAKIREQQVAQARMELIACLRAFGKSD